MIVHRSRKFWLYLAVFQIAFGLTIFAVTRAFYVGDTDLGGNVSAIASAVPAMDKDQGFDFDPAMLDMLTAVQPVSSDPVEISRLADESFVDKRYVTAASLYEELLTHDPHNVDVLNNLGITLHYLGRSSDALVRLNEGASVDPTNQRIYLTLGFVNNALGNSEQARVALTNAVRMDAQSSIGISAAKMLESLP